MLENKEKNDNPLYGKFDEVVAAALGVPAKVTPGNFWPKRTLKYADLFCGIGGFHQAASSLGMECVFACDIDDDCRKAYKENYGLEPASDIRKVEPGDIPAIDLLYAGFPCQPFSIIGSREGFSDARGTLFFEIARIIEAKEPRAFILENVKQLTTHNRGRTLKRILEILKGLGYTVEHNILNALDFGLPQKRERIAIVGFKGEASGFHWPSKKLPRKSLSEVLETDVDPKFYVSERIRRSRVAEHTSKIKPSIWHENKAGHISSHPFSCALRAGASYNYLLVDGERRLTPREMLRLQGFPDTFKIVCTDSQTRQQAGNAVPVPMVRAVMEGMLRAERAATRAKTKGAIAAS